MFPSDTQLIKQLHKTLGRLLSQLSHPEHKSTVNAMQAIANELLLRSNKDFYLGHYRTGQQLFDKALQFAGDAVSVTTVRAIKALPQELARESDANVMRGNILSQMSVMKSVVDELSAAGGTTCNSLLAKIVEWEVDLLAYRLRDPQPGKIDPARALTIDKESLKTYLRTKNADWTDIDIVEFFHVPGGFSKATILFEAQGRAIGKQGFAIRAEQPIHLLDIDGSNVENEYPIVAKAFASGIPVAEPLWLEADTSHFNARLFVSRKATGSTFGTPTGATSPLRSEAVQSLAEVMARIHAIPMHRGEAWIENSHFGKWLDHGSTRSNTLAHVRDWQRQADKANLFPSPQIARAINWLAANVPDYDGAPVFLHGDYGPHNVLLDGNRVTAVLDWETATPGDPALDICWFLNCTTGVVDAQHFLSCYQAAGGSPISEYRLRYFEAYACMSVPIVSNAALRLIEDEDGANVNLALIGLHFGHEYAARLTNAIEKAEAVKHLQ